MRINLLRCALLLTCLPASLPAAAADAGAHRGWEDSPEFTLLATDAERKEWNAVATDAEAERFVALFWARRDPDPKTSPNEFRERFEALAKLADEKFGIGGRRGALTERGKLLILLGPPKSVSVAAGQKPRPLGTKGQITEGTAENAPGTSLGESLVTFTYEASQLPGWAGSRKLVAIFAVEQTRDSLVGPGDVRRIESAAVRAALRNPDLKEAPVHAAAPAPAGAPAPALSAPSPAAAAALEEALAKAPFGALSVLPLTQPDGATRLMLQAYLEGTAAPARAAWLVRGKDGSAVARGEEPVEPQKVLAGVLVDRAIALPPGEYELALVLLDGAGAVVYAARRGAAVPAASGDFRASGLFLASADLPADSSKLDAPFVFAGRKFVARGDGQIRTTDGLSYLVRLHGPGVDPETRKALLRPRVAIQPKGKKALELPAAPVEPVAIQEGRNGQPPIVDVAGTIADANVGDYFTPGEYLFTVTIEDAVRKTKVELSQPFTVVAAPKK